MAFYDSAGKITIDEIVAQSDINKTNSAKVELERAKKLLTNLMNQAAEGEGKTCDAIMEKSRQLITKIDSTCLSLEEAASLIRTTVEKYKHIDEELKNSIQSMNDSVAQTAARTIKSTEAIESKTVVNIQQSKVSTSNSGDVTKALASFFDKFRK